MTKFLLPTTARKAQSSAFVPTEAMNRRLTSAILTVALHADKEARRDDKIQREARAAVAATLDTWIAYMSENDPGRVEDLFFEFACFATATNRKRMLKHSQVPEGVAERTDVQLAQWKADAAAQRSASEASPADENGRGA
ncbi:hypothetical protein EDD52_1073 [Primorskyibacter sedentarius]|uniref:Uncharacterized protein n=1 Tax=Primorskyibacter sedentarius TaxID=745311 RepID=A0A4R3JBS7_9RHOB|nr:hypothetical protein [Primorskyibacter sedentarius]TCS63172.1 hypothetical protein EDD52_1073 [Primorskyibacter sedentarius]